jgi:uncharacterized protein
VTGAAQPAHLVLIEGADHFFTGKLDQMQEAFSDWLATRFLPRVSAP